MITDMDESERKEVKKITINLRDEVLMQAIEIRQKRERDAGTVVSVTEVIKDAVRALYEKEIGLEAESK